MLTDFDENLSFLKERIEEIKYALFKAEIDSLLQLPNNIITTLKTDTEGFIWFYTYCTGNYAPEIDKEFFAHLEYYQKTKNTRIKISGKACIVENDEASIATLNNKEHGDNSNNVLLLKLKIIQATYYEDATKANWMRRIKHTFQSFWFSTGEKTFDFS